MAQTGDPTGTGKGGQSIYGFERHDFFRPFSPLASICRKKFEDEFTRKLKHTGAGILSMANAGPNTNGSQFFVTLAPTPWLDGKHTIFGRVSAGMSVIKRLNSVFCDANDRPCEEVKIFRAYPGHLINIHPDLVTMIDLIVQAKSKRWRVVGIRSW